MATGSGKTYTAVSAVYRMIKYGGAKRVVFLVDRANRGRQTLKEFEQYTVPGDGRKFTELYPVQHLQSNRLDPAATAKSERLTTYSFWDLLSPRLCPRRTVRHARAERPTATPPPDCVWDLPAYQRSRSYLA